MKRKICFSVLVASNQELSPKYGPSVEWPLRSPLEPTGLPEEERNDLMARVREALPRRDAV